MGSTPKGRGVPKKNKTISDWKSLQWKVKKETQESTFNIFGGPYLNPREKSKVLVFVLNYNISPYFPITIL